MDAKIAIIGQFRPNFNFKHCILYYVEGQLYTFGPDFHECGDREEFFFLPYWDSYDTSIPPINFQIYCSEGCFTLKNAKLEPLFLNARLVRKPTQLEFGDVIQIHYHHLFPSSSINNFKNKWKRVKSILKKSTAICDKSIHCDLCFKTNFIFEKRLWENTHCLGSIPLNVECSQVVEEVLENTLILSKIFGFLSVKCLKNCRLVCSYWERESTPILKNLTAVTFKISDYRRPMDTMTFFRYLKEMKEFGGCLNWRIDIARQKDALKESEKFLFDYNKFLSSRDLNCQVKRVHILMAWDYIQEFLNKLLRSKLRHSIEELSFVIVFTDWSRSNNLAHKRRDIASLQLPSLKSLVVEVHVSENSTSIPAEDIEGFTNYVIIPFCRGIHSISLMSQTSEANLWFLNRIVAAGDSVFVNLNQIVIRRIDSKGLDLLLKFKGATFRKIEILGFENSCDKKTFTDFLQKHATVLEELVLNVSNHWGYLILPNVPCLKSSIIRYNSM